MEISHIGLLKYNILIDNYTSTYYPISDTFNKEGNIYIFSLKDHSTNCKYS